MEDKIRMDSHKLIYHPDRVARWQKGENIYPIEVEISPSGACNHRCIFCAVDYIGYQPDYLNKDILMKNIRIMAEKGLKSVICSGEGEPLLNKDMPEIANEIKSCGVDVAMSSNGALFCREIAESCLHAFTWIRFSISSFEQMSYDKIQRGKQGDLDRVKANLADAVAVKKLQNAATTLGVQCLLMPENIHQIADMAKELKEIGIDYFTIKPYSQHLHSQNKMQIDYSQMLELGEALNQITTKDFAIYFRANAMQKMHKEKCYQECYGMPFMTHIDAKGNVWPCVAHIGNEAYCFGNIYENTIEEIWEGSKRRDVMELLRKQDINKVCREACRLDEINKYLDELKHPGEHVNFI